MAKQEMSTGRRDVPSGRAISIQQPFVEEILRGVKRFEYRSRQTHIRGRVYLYASKRPGDDSRWKKLGFEPGDLPSGVIVGSVEIVDCKYFSAGDYYGYKLKNPRRYKKHLKPKNQPQPCFFFPFGKIVKSQRRTKNKSKLRTVKIFKPTKNVFDAIAVVEKWEKHRK